jgi:hypothetical protein
MSSNQLLLNTSQETFSKYLKYKDKYLNLKKKITQIGGIDYNIKSIQISTTGNYLQISQLCVLNKDGINIANIVSFVSKIEASEPYDEGRGRKADIDKVIDGNYSIRNFPDIYHSKNNVGFQYWKITFKEQQDYVNIYYYNRNQNNDRMNGGKLELLDDNDKVFLSFNMTGEFIQYFSNDRIKHFLTTGVDYLQEQINIEKEEKEEERKRMEKEKEEERKRIAKEKEEERKRIAKEKEEEERLKIIEEQKRIEDRKKKEEQEKMMEEQERLSIEILKIIPNISRIQKSSEYKLIYKCFEYKDKNKTYVICIYSEEIQICDIEFHNDITLLHILINNETVNNFITTFIDLFDIIYFCKEKINFDFTLILKRITDKYTLHDITLKYSVLIANKLHLNLLKNYNETEGINVEYVETHAKQIKEENIKYCINLMWVSVESLFKNNLLIKPEYFNKLYMWLSNNPNSKIIFWYDGDIEFTTLLSIINTRLFFDKINKCYPGKIYLRDLSMNPLVMQINTLSPYLFGPVQLYGIKNKRLPLYFRIDLYRVVIAIYLLKEECFNFFVYSDLDIEQYCLRGTVKVPCIKDEIPIKYNKDYLFTPEILQILNVDGLIMQEGTSGQYENSFQIIGSNDLVTKNNIIKALEISILYRNITKNVFTAYTSVPFTDINKIDLKHTIEQNVYGLYRYALILSKYLNNEYKFSYNDIKIKDEINKNLFNNKCYIQNIFESVNQNIRDIKIKIKLYSFGNFPVSAFFVDQRYPSTSKVNPRIFIGGKNRHFIHNKYYLK